MITLIASVLIIVLFVYTYMSNNNIKVEGFQQVSEEAQKKIKKLVDKIKSVKAIFSEKTRTDIEKTLKNIQKIKDEDRKKFDAIVEDRGVDEVIEREMSKEGFSTQMAFFSDPIAYDTIKNAL